MGLRYFLASVAGSPDIVARRCASFMAAVRIPAMKNVSVAQYTAWAPKCRHVSSSIDRNYLSDWFCVTKRPWSGPVSSKSTDPKRFFSPAPQSSSATAVRFQSTSSTVVKDVVLFQHDRTRFFRLLSLFCAGQLLFWTYMAHFAFTKLRDRRRGPAEESAVIAGGPFGLKTNLGSDIWRYGFTITCLAIGACIVGFGVLFCRRSVSRVILHKGGGRVTVTTQSPLGMGRGRSLTVPLAQVACFSHRLESPTFIPLRVKDHRFYFLLDREGTLYNHKLFDVTVGAYRPF